MRKLIKKILFSFILLLVLLSVLLVFLLHSTAGLSTLIKLSPAFIPGAFKAHNIHGSAWQQFTIEELDYQHKGITVKIKNLSVDWQLSGLINQQLAINQIKAELIQLVKEDSTENIQDFSLSGFFNKKHLKIHRLQFNYINEQIYGQLQMMAKPPYTLSGKIELKPKSQHEKALNGIINIAGMLNNLHWNGDFQGPGTLSIKGQLEELSRVEQIIKWRDVHWPQNNFNSPEGRIKLIGKLPQLSIELASKINSSAQENWQLTANAEGTLPWLWDYTIQLSQPLDPSSKHEGLYTNFTAKGSIQDEKHGNLVLTIAPGHFQMTKDSILPLLNFQGGEIKAYLNPKELTGSGSLAIDDHKKLNVTFKLPKMELSKGLSKNQALSADISLIFDSLDFLQILSPSISNPKGQLTALLKTRGTLSKTKIESSLKLSQGSVTLPQLGISLNSIEAQVIAKKQNWEATGSVSAANKKLLLQGRGQLTPSLNGEISLEGTDFSIMNTKEYQIRISPKIKLSFTPTSSTLSGLILVPSAEIKPHSLVNSTSLPDDVVFKTTHQRPTSEFHTSMDLHVEMGNEVEVNTKGLHALLAGNVNVKKLPQGPVSAIGALSVKKGEYKAYGQDLTVEQGQLIFTGGRITNPGINLRASKKIDTTTSGAGANQAFDFSNSALQDANVRGNISVGVEVTGRLTEPKIILFSNPSTLSQADILSMLVLGRPANQANKAGGQLLLAAVSSMNLGNGTNGTQLLEQLKKNYGFDFNVQTTSNYNLATNQISDSTALVVGKSLSKRIYLSYNVGLSQTDPNVLTLKYLLNKFYSIQVSSSTISSGIDILYTSTSSGWFKKQNIR